MGNAGSTAMGFSPNRVKHQGNAYIKDAGLNWMDFSFRQYDPQIGRFLSVDPLAAGTDMLSSFAAMNNQPESVIDPLGLQGFYATYAGFTNRIDGPPGFGSIGQKEGRNKNGLNQAPANAPGGLNGWFSSLAIALANNAALHQALAKISGEPLKIGDVVTDRFGVKHTYLGKDEYGNNMYSVVGVDSRGYYNPNNDPFINDIPAPKHVDDFDGFWGKVNWVLNDGRSGNADYDWNGNYLRANYSVGGIAPVPSFSKIKGIKNISSLAKALRNSVRKGQAPEVIKRVDIPQIIDDVPVHMQKPHVHLKDGRAFNLDGTWKHGEGDISNKIINWIENFL